MSKMNKGFSSKLLLISLILCGGTCLAAQDLEVTCRFEESGGPHIRISGRILAKDKIGPLRSWAFTQSDSSSRISGLELKNEDGQNVPYKKLIEGEYLADSGAVDWVYDIDLTHSGDFTSKAHISWVVDRQGILLTGDLLPLIRSKNGMALSARLKFELPPDWQVITSEKSTGGIFEVENIERGVFAVGTNWRRKEISGQNFSSGLAVFGNWRFTDDEAVVMAGQIFSKYGEMLGGFPTGKLQILLVPVDGKPGRWEAETRGSTVIIVSGDMPFEKLSKQRLHEQLRHELFHLWVPNDLALLGNYDWFYEGFTVYQSLRTGVELNRISFGDFLNTLSEAFNLVNFQDQPLSLTESSSTRRSGANREVYARGMIVAFLCDAALLQNSRGKRTVTDVLRRVYSEHRLSNPPKDGNLAILDILRSYTELRPIIAHYIEGANHIKWAAYLEQIGLEEIRAGTSSYLRVRDKLSGRQKDLLDKLGYNNWRKLSEDSR